MIPNHHLSGQWAGDPYFVGQALLEPPEPANVVADTIQGIYRLTICGTILPEALLTIASAIDVAASANKKLLLSFDSVAGNLEGIQAVLAAMRKPHTEVHAAVINAMGPACVIAAAAKTVIAVEHARLGGLSVKDYDFANAAKTFETFAVEDIRSTRPNCLATAADLRGEMSAKFAYEVDLIDRILEL